MARARDWLTRNWLRLLVHLGGLTLLALLVWSLRSGRFFIDPVQAVTLRTGRLAITFLLLSLACTPVAAITGLRRVVRARRPLGLWALAYTALHLLTFIGWDYRFDRALLRTGVLEQPFVLIGFGAFLLLAALGITSLQGLRVRMGRFWRPFQRLIYLAAALDVWHVLWLRKDPWEVWYYPVILAGLLVLRIPPVGRTIAGVGDHIVGSEESGTQ
ncbi:MAG: sulfite oxidase heme-binding subunit YedZ [Anaerolineae bacterium]